MIMVMDREDNVICTVDDYEELRKVLPELRKKQTVYVDTEYASIEYPKFD